MTKLPSYLGMPKESLQSLDSASPLYQKIKTGKTALTLISADNPILHRPAAPVVQDEIEQAVELGTQMLTFLHLEFPEVGLALAAPQIGSSLRIFVVRPACICINPEIVKTYGTKIPPRLFRKPVLEDGEGCLSYLGLEVVVPRWEKMVVRFMNHRGETVEQKLSGIESIAFQHELDHLNGITIGDFNGTLSDRSSGAIDCPEPDTSVQDTEQGASS